MVLAACWLWHVGTRALAMGHDHAMDKGISVLREPAQVVCAT